ncbi:unnamed protein product [Caenorhabditis brenneri]
MWIYSLLLPLCLLGATAAQPFYFDGNHHHPRGFAALDDSEAVVKTFLEKMTKTIETKDSGAIADLFAEDFFFKGCKGDYDKTQFLLCAKTGKLSGGSVPACKRTHFHGSAGGNSVKRFDASHDLVEEFMTKMAKFYKTQDSMIIAELFQSNFTFKSCDVIYNKKEAVTIMTAVPLSSSFIYRITSVADQGEVIECNVSVDGLGQTDVQFTFVLNKHHLKLESAGFAACPTAPTPSRKQLTGWKNPLAPASEDSNTVISEFLNTLGQTLASHDSTAIGQLFDDNFVFKGCRGTYNKAETLAKINQVPKEANFNFALKSSNWNKEGQIEYTVTVSGALRDDFDAQFVYCPYRKVLKSGSIPSCPSTSSRRKLFEEEGEEWPEDQFDFMDDSDRSFPNKSVSVFLNVLNGKIRHPQSPEKQIARQFADSFVFKGCKASYNKAETLKKIAEIPEDVIITQKSAKWINDIEIEFTATVRNVLPNEFDAQFVYEFKKHYLKSVTRLSCPAKRMFAEDEGCILWPLLCF